MSKYYQKMKGERKEKMFGSRIKRIIAVLCMCLMIFGTIGENAMIVKAASPEFVTSVDTEDVSETASEDMQEEVVSSESSEEETEEVISEEEAEEIISEEIITVENALENDNAVADSGTLALQSGADYTLKDGVLTIAAHVGSISAWEFSVDETLRDSITKLQFEEGSIINFIGANAFYDCENLAVVDLSNCKDLTIIDDKAFGKCTALNKLVFSEGLQEIRDSAFSDCTGLQEVTLTKSLITIEKNAFEGCENLATVKIEASNISCASSTNIFKGCNISKVVFSDETKVVPSGLFNGARFYCEYDPETEDPIRGTGYNLVIPNHIQEVATNAFANSNLMYVTFEDTAAEPSALASIGESAFYNCKYLEDVTFPLTVKVIGDNAFAKCIRFGKINIPNSVTTLGKGCFSDCEQVVEISLSNSVANLGANTFMNCVSLQEVVVPVGIAEISAGMFGGCASLESVTIPSTVKSIGKEAFKLCISLDNVVVPQSVTSVGSSAFSSNLSLKKITLSSNITAYPTELFLGCSSLRSITVPGYVQAGTVMAIPGNVTSIGSKAFAACSSITELYIPASVTTIGGQAFLNCTNIGTVTIDSVSITSCGVGIFEECLLKDVVFAKGITKIPSNLFNKAHFTTGRTITIPATVTEIGSSAFAGAANYANNISYIKFESGSSLQKIGDKAFQYCTALTSFTIPEYTSHIGSYAFGNCVKLEGITIPENVVSLGAGAFNACEVLTTVRYNAIAVTSSNKNIFADCNIHTILIGDKVTILPAYLFYGAKFSTNQVTGDAVMVTLEIPASMKKMGQYCLANIVNLEEVVFETGNTLEEIGDYAFYECSGMKKCNFPDTVKIIGTHAFEGCKSLVGVDLPENVTSIGSAAFRGCVKLTSFTVPAGVTEIMDLVFADNTALKSVTIEGDSLTAIGANAFYGCSALENMIIPQGVTKIGEGAFSGCTSVTKVRIPASVTEIGDDAFKSCTKAMFYVVRGSYAETWLLSNGFGNQIYYVNSITYELNGGTNHPLNIAGYEPGDVFKFYPASKEGYDFKGWYLDSAFTQKVTDLTGRSGDFTLYAKWGKADYTITYVLDGGVNHPDNPAGYSFDDEDIVLKNPTKKGYVFKGWYKEDTFKNKVTKIASGSSGNITLYAKWNVIKYTITFEKNGSDATGSLDSIKVEGTESFFMPESGAFERAGYTQTGWNTKSDGTGTAYAFGEMVSGIETTSTSENQTVKIYAQWEANKYIVFFDAMGGTCDESSREIAYGAKYGTLPTPEYPGYKFEGWYTEAEGGTKITTSTVFKGAENTTLYARWKANQYTVKFDGNADNAKVSTKSITVEFGQPYGTKMATATRDGYTFEGWFTENNQLITSETIVTIPENHTLFARWMSSASAEPPVANYESGEIAAGTKITLTTKTPGADIYYTVDGSYPTTSSLRYADSIVITKDTVIKAVTKKDGYNDSPVVQYQYTIIDESGNWGDIREEDRAGFEDASKVPQGIWVAGIKDAVYSGTAVTFDVRVYDYKTLLRENVDYTIKYSNNKNAAKTDAKKAPTVTITAKGDYKGKIAVKFNILPLDINGAEFDADNVYAVANGKLQKPVPTVYRGTTKLKNKKDFTVSYPDSSMGGYVEAGTYRVQITGAGNYTGVRTVDFVLKPNALISKMKISVTKAMPYTGSPVVPEIVVKNGSTILAEGVDYTVTLKNNVDAGTASAIITGINDYSGSKRVNFKINPIALMKKTQISFNKASVTYTGEPIKLNEGKDPLTASVSYNGQTLELGKDYVIKSYSKNVTVGTASVVFEGKGGYTGTVTKKFKIAAVNVNNLTVSFLDSRGNVITGDAVYAYVKGGCKPQVRLTYGNMVLKSGIDYSVSYKNNKAQGVASMTIKGKKNFNASRVAYYTITAQALSNVSLIIPDVNYQEAADIYPTKPVLMDSDGKNLKAGTDYEKTFKYAYSVDTFVTNKGKKVFRKAGAAIESGDILPVGTVIKITITGKGNYTGEAVGLYRIAKGDISKAKVTVKSQEYTGYAVEPGKDDITVKVGNTTLSKNDYEIIGYRNNVNKGTASVIIRGKGNYCGTKVVKFKIVQKTFSLWP